MFVSLFSKLRQREDAIFGILNILKMLLQARVEGETRCLFL